MSYFNPRVLYMGRLTSLLLATFTYPPMLGQRCRTCFITWTLWTSQCAQNLPGNEVRSVTARNPSLKASRNNLLTFGSSVQPQFACCKSCLFKGIELSRVQSLETYQKRIIQEIQEFSGIHEHSRTFKALLSKFKGFKGPLIATLPNMIPALKGNKGQQFQSWPWRSSTPPEKRETCINVP